jgi:hypothetical protein
VDLKINKKMFEIANGQSFDDFVKEIESTRNNDYKGHDEDAVHKGVMAMVRNILQEKNNAFK